MARTWVALDRLEQVFGIVPAEPENCTKRGRELVEEYRRQLHEDFGQLGGEARKAFAFVRNIADEELSHVQVGTGAEVALRHISRKAREVIGDE